VSQMLIHFIILECSLSPDNCLEKVIQAEWLGASMILLSFLLDELGMVQIKDYVSFWIKRMTNSFLFSKIILVSNLLLQTFYKNNQRFFQIMNLSHS